VPVLVVLPSFNEAPNIVDIVQQVLDGDTEHHVCVVDDSSPDGTADRVAQALSAREGWQRRVCLIVRTTKGGRGGAVRHGLEWGIRQDCYRAFVEMDCDFSHDPKAISEGLSLIARGADVAIGARYPNGTLIGWPRGRRMFSYCANLLARTLIDWRVADFTNGFRFYSPAAVRELLRHEQRHTGYIYLSETISHLLRAGYVIESFPIVFRNRERGASNMRIGEIMASLRGVVAIAMHHRRGAR
jgi:dolichol-phosphate mannosyltransferase